MTRDDPETKRLFKTASDGSCPGDIVAEAFGELCMGVGNVYCIFGLCWGVENGRHVRCSVVFKEAVAALSFYLADSSWQYFVI